MKAIIMNKDGTYYGSKVFAVINDKIHLKNDPSNYSYAWKYLVLNEKGDNIIIRDFDDKNIKSRCPVLIYDIDKSDMTINDDGIGKVNFISEKEFNDILAGNPSKEVIERCIKYKYVYQDDYVEIKSQKDADNLMEVAYGFHDGYVKNINGNDEKLKLLISGIWGCDIELIFTGNVQYMNKTTLEEGNIKWMGASVTYTDLISTDLETGESSKYGTDVTFKDDDESFYFSGYKLKYKIIPKLDE